jgi:effector-binding domain-containing protein
MALTFHVEERIAQTVALVRGRMRPDEIGAFVGPAFGEVLAALGAQGLQPAGPPFCRYRMQEDAFDVEAGFPASGPVVPTGRVEPDALPAGSVATTMHVGAYDKVGEVYEELIAWVETQGLVPAGEPWESYLDGPEVTQPRTVIYLPCARP